MYKFRGFAARESKILANFVDVLTHSDFTSDARADLPMEQHEALIKIMRCVSNSSAHDAGQLLQRGIGFVKLILLLAVYS